LITVLGQNRINHRVVFALAVIVASQWWMVHLAIGWTQSAARTYWDVVPVAALLAIPAGIGLLVVRDLNCAQYAGTRPLAVVLLAGLIMRLPWYGATGPYEDDYYRYLWDGAVLLAGHNPYAFPPTTAMSGEGLPAALAPLAAQAKDILKFINFPELVTIYPGTAQLAFAISNIIAPLNLDALRFVFLIADVAAFFMLARLLAELDRPPVLAALYWLNPLVVWSTQATVHVDALLPPFVLATCLYAWRQRYTTAAISLAFAVGVKLWPVLLVPVLARHAISSKRNLAIPAIAFLALTTVLTAPLAYSALFGVRSGLVAYSQHWWVNNGPFSWISWGVYQLTAGDPLGQRALRFVLVAIVGAIAVLVARRPPRDLRHLLTAATTVAATTFYFAPAQFPWYALWFLPLAAATECLPLLLASVTLAEYFFIFPMISRGIGWAHAYAVAFLHALPVWGWLTWRWLSPGFQTPAALKPRPPSPSAS
jgi:alpha-1,6-mannosyltransferase